MKQSKMGYWISYKENNIFCGKKKGTRNGVVLHAKCIFITGWIKGNWHERYFNNQNPIVLEVGCGRGEYTVSLGRKYPG